MDFLRGTYRRQAVLSWTSVGAWKSPFDGVMRTAFEMTRKSLSGMGALGRMPPVSFGMSENEKRALQIIWKILRNLLIIAKTRVIISIVSRRKRMGLAMKKVAGAHSGG